MENVDLDAGAYARRFGYVAGYGNALLDLLDMPAGSSVLDLGCGNGNLTARLLRKGMRPTGMDASSQQLDHARRLHPELTFMHADAADFRVDEPVDAVFSNAAMHWIPAARHEAMIRCINHALKPGGLLVFEMGGKGNNASIHEEIRQACAKRGLDYQVPFHFPSPGEYATLLERNGFRVERLEYFDRPTPFESEDGLITWLDMFARPLRDLPEDVAREVKEEVQDALAPAMCEDDVWTLDYVRLRVKARKVEEAPEG